MTDKGIKALWKDVIKAYDKCKEKGVDNDEVVLPIRLAKDTSQLIERMELTIEDYAETITKLEIKNKELKDEVERVKDEDSNLKFHLMAMESAANLYKKNHDVLEEALQFQKLKNEAIKFEAMEDLAVKIKKELINEAKNRESCEQCQRDIATLEALELVDRVLRETIKERF